MISWRGTFSVALLTGCGIVDVAGYTRDNPNDPDGTNPARCDGGCSAEGGARNVDEIDPPRVPEDAGSSPAPPVDPGPEAPDASSLEKLCVGPDACCLLERRVDYPGNDVGPPTMTTLEGCCALMLKSAHSAFQTTRFGECFIKTDLPIAKRVAAGTAYVAGRRAPP